MEPPKNEPALFHLKMEKAMLERLDDFRFQYRFESRAEAHRWLLNWALEQKPIPHRGYSTVPLSDAVAATPPATPQAAECRSAAPARGEQQGSPPLQLNPF